MEENLKNNDFLDDPIELEEFVDNQKEIPKNDQLTTLENKIDKITTEFMTEVEKLKT